MITLAVAIAGALGAPSRYVIERSIAARFGSEFPWGTLIVNLLGSAALGLVAGRVEVQHMSTDLAHIAGVGFLGAFTTFSTLTVEASRLRPGARYAYVGASVGGGLLLAGAGLALTAG